MASTFTPNKYLEEPANGDYNNDWNVVVNADWTAIDTAFGGSSVITVTGVTAGTYTLSVSQYQPPNIRFNGTIGGLLVYEVPAGVGGVWTVYNNTTGNFSLYFAVTSGGSLVMPQGQRSIIVSDGVNLSFAQSGPSSACVTTGENRTNTTVLANSSYLTIPLVNLGTYEVVVGIGAIVPAAAGISFNVNYSGTIGISGLLAWGSNGNIGEVIPLPVQIQTSPSGVSYTLPGNSGLLLLNLQGSLTISTPGTVAFAFAQTTANASPTTLSVGSYMKLTPIFSR
jgi:hypothetical protein